MKVSYRKILLAFIVVSVTGLGLVAYLNHRIRSLIPVEFESIETTADGGIKIDKVHYSGTKEGRLEWELDAMSATHKAQEELTELDDVTLKYYREQGLEYTMKSDRGSYNGKTGRIDASGHVVVTSNDGYTLKAAKLSFLKASKRLKSSGRVKITSKAMRVSGTGLDMDVDAGLLEVVEGCESRDKPCRVLERSYFRSA